MTLDYATSTIYSSAPSCPKGTYRTSLFDPCLPCWPNTFSSSDVTPTTCKACPVTAPASVQGSPSISYCHVPCGAGHYWSVPQSATGGRELFSRTLASSGKCRSCDPGTYWPGGVDTAACTPCPAGSSSKSGASSCTPYLQVALKAEPNEVSAGHPYTVLTATVTVADQTTAQEVYVRLELPTGFSYDAASTPLPRPSMSGSTVTWTLGTLLPKKSKDLKLGLKLKSTASSGTVKTFATAQYLTPPGYTQTVSVNSGKVKLTVGGSD